MAVGTDAGLLESPKPQSVYKHGIIEQYYGPAGLNAVKLPFLDAVDRGAAGLVAIARREDPLTD